MPMWMHFSKKARKKEKKLRSVENANAGQEQRGNQRDVSSKDHVGDAGGDDDEDEDEEV